MSIPIKVLHRVVSRRLDEKSLSTELLRRQINDYHDGGTNPDVLMALKDGLTVLVDLNP
jgi:hypothetical protein